MNGYFENKHPLLQLFYFFAAAGLSMLFLHPVLIGASLLGALLYHCKLTGIESMLKDAKLVLYFSAFSALVNALVNHRGATKIFLLFGKPVTKEALLFGFLTGLSFSSVMIWFFCYDRVFTSEKIMLVFGKRWPTLAISFAIVLRFVPNFLQKAREITAIQRGLGVSITNGTFGQKAKNAVQILSILITYALEGTAQTAMSMKKRGFGITQRGTYIEQKWKVVDTLLAVILCIEAVLMGIIVVQKTMRLQFFPITSIPKVPIWGVVSLVAFFFLPFLIDIMQEFKWIYLQSKI